MITLEGPAGSWMWAYLAKFRPQVKQTWLDLKLSQCLFGTPYRKDTLLRCWSMASRTPSTQDDTTGDLPFGEVVQCTRSGGRNTCGRAKHDILAFDGTPTGPAAAYPKALCTFIARLLLDFASKVPTASLARQTVVAVAEGRVHRHTLRGTTDDSQRDKKEGRR